jgi:hypothetical protein
MTEVSGVELTDFLRKVLTNNSPATLLLIILANATWLVGGNLLVAKHYRRLGKSPWAGFKPFAFPFAKFNAREWGILAILVVMTFTLFILAMFVDHPINQ